ncbi:MAG: hypothetical protein ABIJ81_03785 [Patescibacteria group bacterium]
MKASDFLAMLYFLAITAFLFFATDTFIAWTRAYPYLMGFAKVALLATFGECLRHRISLGQWLPDKVFLRFVVWGVFGVWFTAAFPFVDGGVKTIMAGNLWPDLWSSFSMSLWINLFSGYAFSMMLVHYWIDHMIKCGYFLEPWYMFSLHYGNGREWAKVVILSIIFFWLPAHTFTFSLPPIWRVICAAYLAVFLGLILSFATKRQK